jgi:hypothetical protein
MPHLTKSLSAELKRRATFTAKVTAPGLLSDMAKSVKHAAKTPPTLTPAQKATILGDPDALDPLRLRASNALIDLMGDHYAALSSAQRIALMDVAD